MATKKQEIHIDNLGNTDGGFYNKYFICLSSWIN